MKTPLLMFVAGLVFLSAANVLQAADPADEFFESHVRPILVEHCQECHGSKKQWAELRLDSHSFMMKGGENGPVVVPGKPEESRLIQVIHYSDDDSQMPPDGKLADEQIARLTEWISAGAHWPAESAPVAVDFFTAADAHWAFQPITSHPVPTAPETARVAGPIDSFVVARLQQAGLQQSERADPRTQLRRLALDLTGLPPSFEDVQAFTADSSEEAWSKVIDRYLSSPTFGQKWARHWLDLARYADTKGYVFTEERRYPFAYTYRDYVVDAFNRDLPYDLFITEQLAADLIPDRRDDGALAAMGFLTVGNRFLNQTSEIYDDRIDVTIRGLMGLTITCARCHDHKFDPIEMGDYYALRGVFDSSVEPEQLPQIGESNDPQAYAGFQAEKEKLEAKLNEFQVEKATAISQEVGAHMEHYLLAIAVNRKFTSGLYTLEEKYEVRNRFRDELFRFLAAQKVEDPFFGPIRQVIHLNMDNYDTEAPKRIEAIYKQLESGSFVANELLAARLQQSRPVTFFDFAKLYGPLISTALAEESTWPEAEKEAWRALREHLKATQFPVPFSPESVTGYFNRDESNGRRERIKNVDNLIATSPGAPPHAMVLNDKPNPSNPFIFKRGNPGMRGDAVPRRFLKVLDSVRAEPFSNQSSGRLELAQAIASRENPLTARVFVNRVWMLLIGAPLVSDTSDFGLRTEPPTHPELLDDLSYRFMENNWSVKWLIREIVRSETYRQVSFANPRGNEVDLENRLVWRMNRKRIPFETLRDSLLQSAGILDTRLNGRPEELEGNNPTHRRAIYGYIDRNNVSLLLRNFDVAGPNTTVSARSRTTVPQQALFLMNSPFVQMVADKVVVHCGGDIPEAPDTNPEAITSRIDLMYHQILQREPETSERTAAMEYISTGGATKQAWKELAQVLLLTNEFSFID